MKQQTTASGLGNWIGISALSGGVGTCCLLLSAGLLAGLELLGWMGEERAEVLLRVLLVGAGWIGAGLAGKRAADRRIMAGMIGVAVMELLLWGLGKGLGFGNLLGWQALILMLLGAAGAMLLGGTGKGSQRRRRKHTFTR